MKTKQQQVKSQSIHEVQVIRQFVTDYEVRYSSNTKKLITVVKPLIYIMNKSAHCAKSIKTKQANKLSM
jgi:hypothetical protein